MSEEPNLNLDEMTRDLASAVYEIAARWAAEDVTRLTKENEQLRRAIETHRASVSSRLPADADLWSVLDDEGESNV